MKSIYLGESFLKKYDIIFSFLYYKQYKNSLFNDLPTTIDKSKFIGLPLISNGTIFHKINLKVKNRLFRRLLKSPLFIISNCGIYFFWNAIVFICFIKKTKPAIFHINNGGFPASEVCNQLAFLLKIFFPRVKVIYQVNSSPSTNSKIIVKIVDWTVKYFITHSESNRLKLLNIGINDVKLKFFPSFFDDEFYIDLKLIDYSKFNIVSVGYLEKRKGHIFLIESINHIKKFNKELYNNIHLHIVGSGEEYEYLSNYINLNKLETNVTLWGNRNDYLYFIKFCDVFVLPSISNEDLPLVLLSAMKYEKCIVSTNFAGMREILTHQYDCYLVEPHVEKLVAELCEALYFLLENPLVRAKYSEKIRLTYIRNFSKEKYFNNMKELYESE